jgi:hypothetical protein
MRKDTAFNLVEIGLAIILFLAGYLMRTLPLWIMIVAFTAGSLLLIVGLMGLTGIWDKVVSRIKKPRQRNEAKTVAKKDLQLKLVKLFHDGKDIQANLNRAQAQRNTSEQVSAEIHFESWLTDVSNVLKNTEFMNLWYENKVVNYRDNSLSDYIGASNRALDRLESIIDHYR